MMRVISWLFGVAFIGVIVVSIVVWLMAVYMVLTGHGDEGVAETITRLLEAL